MLLVSLLLVSYNGAGVLTMELASSLNSYRPCNDVAVLVLVLHSVLVLALSTLLCCWRPCEGLCVLASVLVSLLNSLHDSTWRRFRFSDRAALNNIERFET